MKTGECTDRKLGSLLFAYEIGALGPEDIDRFELHLLECEHCFDAAQRFSRYAKMIREDEIIAGEVAKSIDSDARSLSVGKRMKQYFWPGSPLPFRPAVLYLIIIIMLYPAYTGIFHPRPRGFSQMQSINLSPTRASADETFSLSAGRDGLIVFIFDGAIPGRKYTITIVSDDGSTIYVDDSFTAFDNFATGRLTFPLELMKPGEYRLEIYDALSDTAGDKQIYQFEIIE